ncbi:MAG: AAA family ATPase [Clostridia bacterium]|nr:AAA family ATPase [Clostridia bacterium]
MRYITVGEAAGILGLSTRRTQQMCKNGQISGARKEGRSWVIREDALAWESGNTRRPLPVGISQYIRAVTDYYYVDKTLLIRDFIDTLPSVSLFTRPRRFGKTLNMDMLRVFFEKTEEDTSVYFRDKAIWQCGEKYRRHQGMYPVIYLSFKDVKYTAWPEAFENIRDNIRNEYARHSELADSNACNPVEKAYYDSVIGGNIGEVGLAASLAMLSSMLKKHYGTGAVIIIDEYDTPVQQGYVCGYYDSVINFIRNLFSGAFKDNPALAYGFMTGILRVAKESIFSGMNNLKVNTVLDNRYSEYFGFTRQEILDMLAYYGKEDRMDEVCRWYDGYRFGKTEIFNPWSVINYLDEDCTPGAYWRSTGSNAVIGEIIAGATPEISEDLHRLMQGEEIRTFVDTGVIYPEIRRNPAGVYSFLLVAGYLKCGDIDRRDNGYLMCSLSIPNREIACVYTREIIDRLSDIGAESIAADIQNAVCGKDTARLQECIQKYLLQTISVYDSSSESFYHGLMLGLCAILNDRFRVRSNRESGRGRFDIQLEPLTANLPGFIFELKASKDPGESLDALADAALRQISDKGYETEMKASGVHEIIPVGIAFRGKEIAVKHA